MTWKTRFLPDDYVRLIFTKSRRHRNPKKYGAAVAQVIHSNVSDGKGGEAITVRLPLGDLRLVAHGDMKLISKEEYDESLTQDVIDS